MLNGPGRPHGPRPLAMTRGWCHSGKRSRNDVVSEGIKGKVLIRQHL